MFSVSVMMRYDGRPGLWKLNGVDIECDCGATMHEPFGDIAGGDYEEGKSFEPMVDRIKELEGQLREEKIKNKKTGG